MKRIILFLCILLYSLFSNNTNLLAKEIGNDIENKLSNEIKEIKPEQSNKQNIAKSSAEDIFGDEQTFPFIAGLGKNAAH